MKLLAFYVLGIIVSLATLNALKTHAATNFFTDSMITALIVWVFAMIGVRSKEGETE